VFILPGGVKFMLSKNAKL